MFFMATGELKWLGPPEIEVDGRSVKLETRKGAALLAFLFVEGRPYSRKDNSLPIRNTSLLNLAGSS